MKNNKKKKRKKQEKKKIKKKKNKKAQIFCGATQLKINMRNVLVRTVV